MVYSLGDEKESGEKQVLPLRDAQSVDYAGDVFGHAGAIVRALLGAPIPHDRSVPAVPPVIGKCRRATLWEVLMSHPHEPFASDHCWALCGCSEGR